VLLCQDFKGAEASQSYRASPATWVHTVLPATCHKLTCFVLTPASWRPVPELDLSTLERWTAKLT